MTLTVEAKQQLCEACKFKRHYFCRKHGDEVRRIVKRRATCEGWGNDVSTARRTVNNLAVICCHFNPCGYKMPVANAHRFLDEIGVPVTLVELSFDGRF